MPAVTVTDVDSFGARLAAELNTLDWQTRNEIIVRIGKAEMAMRSSGAERPVWKGPLPVDRMLGRDAVVQTDQGERRGRVVCFGISRESGDWERSVIIYSVASGTQHESPGSLTRLASAEDSARILEETEMASRLHEASSVALRAPVDPQAAARRAKRRGMKDPRLIETLLKMARDHANVLDVEEGSVNHKVIGRDGKKRVYVFKSQLRVDVAGFAVEHPGIKQISDQEARDMHLGKVRGQFTFEDRDEAVAAFASVLEAMK